MKDQPDTLSFRVQGMTCADEVDILRREVGPVVGGAKRLSFDVLNSRMTVAPGAPAVAARQVVEAVARTGMRAEAWRDGDVGSGALSPSARYGQAALTVASGLLCLAGLLVHAGMAGGLRAAVGSEGMGLAHEVPISARLLYALGIVAGGWRIAPRALLAARRLRPDMNLLMTVAVMGAIAIGEWFEAATVTFLFALSPALETWSVGRARRAIKALMDLAPLAARVRREDGTEAEVPPDEVAVGAVFVVKPGEKLPLDGLVVRGLSSVNQAPITGESLPVPKAPGDAVFAGTINGDGALEVQSTKPASDTTLAHIVRMVDEAHYRRAPSEQWVERFARIYTPAVMGLALAVLLLPPLAFGGAWGDWLYRALVLLVIGCPCALVISTPVSIVTALAGTGQSVVVVGDESHVCGFITLADRVRPESAPRCPGPV